MQHSQLARQSIYDKNLHVIAYELLFRPGDDNESNIDNQAIDGDRATSTVILNAFADIGLEEVIGDHLAFINFTRNLLIKDVHSVLPANKIVIEILEDVKIDEKLIESVRSLRQQGYVIALDDFVLAEEWKPLVELADIIKLDVLKDTPEDIANKVKPLENYNVDLLAEKIETHEIFEACRALGFKYFQGYFLSKPNILKSEKIDPNRTVALKLLSELQKPDVEIGEIEHTLSQDVSLTYKLLRLINSAAYGTSRKIESLREAIVRSGIDNIRNWATLLILSNTSTKPIDLMLTTMVRAKMCEQLANKIGDDKASVFFTTGLFSTLDAMLDKNLDEILQRLPLSDELNTALLEHEGTMGKLLNNTIAYERGNWDIIDYPPLTAQDYAEAYFNSINWAHQAIASLQA